MFIVLIDRCQIVEPCQSSLCEPGGLRSSGTYSLSVIMVYFSHCPNIIAIGLNLHQLPATKPTNEKQECEILNRIRV